MVPRLLATLAFAGVLLAACAPTPKATEANAASKESAMKLPPIVQAGAGVLRTPAAVVAPEQIPTASFQELVKTMIAVMRKAPGVGLAAPQIGVPLRVIVLEDRDDLIRRLAPDERVERERTPFAPRVFVNPELELVGTDKATFFEGCLSVNGYVGLVERSREVVVKGLDENGVATTWQVRGWPARILQHEVDHIHGTLYVDRMITRSFTNADQAKALYGGKPIAEIRRMIGLE